MKPKKLIAMISAMAVMISCTPQIDAENQNTESIIRQPSTLLSAENNMKVSGTDTLGNLLADELSAVSTEQKENNGYNIFSVEVEGTKASVSFETLQDSAIVVAIYDNDNIKMITSGYTEVSAEETEAVIEINTEDIPKYFYIRAYLVNPDKLRPLSTEYSSPMYTQSMQEFLSKTVDDFDSDKVINLDENEDTNFAVFEDNIIIIPEETGKNTVISANDETLTYVFGNIDENITSLKAGDIFAYEYEDKLLIVKVENVSVSGTTATVTGQNMELEEVFEHLRIDGEAFSQDAEVDASGLEEGITYEGLVEDDESNITPQAIDLEGKASYSHKFGFEKKGEYESGTSKASYSFFAGLELKLDASANVYVSFSEVYVQLKLDYSAALKAEFEGKVSKSFPLAYFSFSPVPGVYISITPSFVVEFDGKASIDGKLYGTVGFKASTNGMENLTTTPKLDLNGKIEVTIFIGLSLEPKIKIISDKIANAKLTAKAGAEVKATLKKTSDEKSNIRHECNACIGGDINAKFSLSTSIKLLNKEKWKFEITLLDKRIHLFDFYFSLTYNEFGFAECPHISYLTKITVSNTSLEKLKNVKITDDKNPSQTVITGDDGTAQIWLTTGEHTLKLEAEGYKTKNTIVKIGAEKDYLNIVLIAEKEISAGDLFSGMFDEIADGMLNPYKVKKVELAMYQSAAITANNNLYMWGNNQFGQLGDGSYEDREYPVKILDNVDSVYLSDVIGEIWGLSAAITTDGELYMWGYNRFGQVGNGTWEDCEYPVKVMDDIAYVSHSDFNTAAITEDGDLYTWGENSSGELGDGTWDDRCTPIKIMENVAYVNTGGTRSAITTDGSLYTWGYNGYGLLGNGTSHQDSNVPQKIMDNVSYVVTTPNPDIAAAITTDGSLYMWGSNDYGQLGNGTTQDSYVPIKIMDNVASVSIYGYTTVVLTKNGEVYTWGDNSDSALGSGKNYWELKYSCIPIKIMDNVTSACALNRRGYAIMSDESLYAWGDSHYGMLNRESSVPIKIMDNIAIVKNAAMTTAVLTTDGKLYMCGHNGFDHCYDTPTRIKFGQSNAPSGKMRNNFVTQSLPEEVEYTTVASLLPNEIYNYYVVKDRTANDILSSDNLVYIGQAQSDENGTLTIPEEAQNGTVFVKAMREFDVYNAEITSAEVKDSSATLKWNPVENAQEYEVYCFTQGGIMSTIKTTDTTATFDSLKENTIYGFLVTSTVYGECSVPYIDDVLVIKTEEAVKITLGDLNNDSKININDVKIALRGALNNNTLTDEQKIAADVNEDKKVNISDVKIILKAALNGGTINS